MSEIDSSKTPVELEQEALFKIFEIKSTDFPTPEAYDEQLQEIGRFRYKVWLEEGAINDELCPGKCFLDHLDLNARQYIVRSNATDGSYGDLLATARLTFHDTFEDGYRDVALWRDAGINLPLPTCDLGRLGVLKAYRGKGTVL
jgi:hypothetical protein